MPSKLIILATLATNWINRVIFLYYSMSTCQTGMRRYVCGGCNSSIPTQPIVLLACGSFNPVTISHLRMMGTLFRIAGGFALHDQNISLKYKIRSRVNQTFVQETD